VHRTLTHHLLSNGGSEAAAGPRHQCLVMGHCAQSRESGLAIVRSEHVDVMLIDFRIPDMRVDVVNEVAAGHESHLRYQTLFMTGDITDRARDLIAACRCNFLRKPFDLRDMFDAIAARARVLGKKGSRCCRRVRRICHGRIAHRGRRRAKQIHLPRH